MIQATRALQHEQLQSYNSSYQNIYKLYKELK
jgi:hypothetical protein